MHCFEMHREHLRQFLKNYINKKLNLLKNLEVQFTNISIYQVN